MQQETGNDADVGYVENGRVKCIRVNRTGAWIWQILQSYYSDLETLEQLVSMGDCFYFARNIGPTRYQPGEQPGPNDCKFYIRESQRNHYGAPNECSIRDFFKRSTTYKFLFVDGAWFTQAGEYLVVPLRLSDPIPRSILEVTATCREELSLQSQQQRNEDAADGSYSEDFTTAGLFGN